jgi:hypothetical protein
VDLTIGSIVLHLTGNNFSTVAFELGQPFSFELVTATTQGFSPSGNTGGSIDALIDLQLFEADGKTIVPILASSASLTPEPATYALMGLGLLAFAAYRKSAQV